jgi:hypothetical protein
LGFFTERGIDDLRGAAQGYFYNAFLIKAPPQDTIALRKTSGLVSISLQRMDFTSQLFDKTKFPLGEIEGPLQIGFAFIQGRFTLTLSATFPPCEWAMRWTRAEGSLLAM